MPSPAAGFVTSPHAQQALTTSFAVMKLSAVVTDFANAKAFGGQTYFGDLEIDLDTVAGGATALTAMLTYDLLGLYSMAGPSASTTFATLSGALGTLTFAIDKPKTLPARATIVAGECYLWLKTNAGTANVSASGARLHWRDMHAA